MYEVNVAFQKKRQTANNMLAYQIWQNELIPRLNRATGRAEPTLLVYKDYRVETRTIASNSRFMLSAGFNKTARLYSLKLYLKKYENKALDNNAARDIVTQYYAKSGVSKIDIKNTIKNKLGPDAYTDGFEKNLDYQIKRKEDKQRK